MPCGKAGVERLILDFWNVLAEINTLHLAHYGRSTIAGAAITLKFPMTRETTSENHAGQGEIRLFTCNIPCLGGHRRADLQANDTVPISSGQT
jgi:hypothetical protein